jgi:enolase-phosphatase E1
VFSSGSVAAQRLFLAHTGVVGEDGGEEGADVSGLFGGRLFDTVNAGPKMEAGSYHVIARELAVVEGDVLFLSDNVRGWSSF